MNACLLVLLLVSVPQARRHVDETNGLAVEVPEGWIQAEDRREGEFTLYVAPPDTGGRVLIGFSVIDLAEGQGLEALVQRSLTKIASDPSFSELERFEAELLGETRPALAVRMRSEASGDRRIEALFLVDEGRGFVVQRAAPPEEFASWSEELERVVATFRPLAVTDAMRRARTLARLAARCGSEADWAPSWEEAARRAHASGRPILVVAWLYGAFDLPYTPRSSTFMDEDVLELVRERFVLWQYRPGEASAFRERYGLSATGFGQGLLVVTAEGQTRFESERATDPDFAHEFLRRALAALAAPAAALAGDTPLERARSAVARGELERARGELAEPADPAAWLLRARIERLSRDAEQAGAALERARAGLAPGHVEGERALCIEEARTYLRFERPAAARAACATLLERHAGTPEALEATLLLALLEAAAGDRAAARARFEALVEGHPESRWAWLAAVQLAGGLLDLDLPIDLGFPEAELVEECLTLPAPAPLAPSEDSSARAGALAWLLAAQRDDGSWISPMELSASDARGPSPFVDAVTALAARALMRHRDEPEVAAALGRALAFLVASVERRAREEAPVLYMDYTPWSDAALLETLALAWQAEPDANGRMRSAAEAVLADLERRAQPHGGWGYYVTSSLDGPSAPPTAMSFTTAAVLLALNRAHAAGLPVPEELRESKGTRALAAMRDPSGVFAYSVGAGGGAGVAAGMEPGAAGRAPACELALLGAGASDAARVQAALEQFLRFGPTLAAEQGKVLMHAGAAAQGCHYVLFDYAWAAAAWRAIEGDAKTRVRLLELLLACRQADGSFLDTPINGRAYGTAMALLALDDLAGG